MRAIESVYHGYKFRSKLEARWCVFFDALGLRESEYQYEQEGLESKTGMRYLPDFRVKCYSNRGRDVEPYWLYIEVKGEMDAVSAKKINSFSIGPASLEAYQEAYEKAVEQHGEPTYADDERILEFVEAYLNRTFCKNDYIPLLVVGDIPYIEMPDDVNDDEHLGCYESLGYEIYPFNYETIDGDHFGAFPTVRDGKFGLHGHEGSYCCWGDNYRTAAAYMIAQQVRFDHGQTPTPSEVRQLAKEKVAEIEAEDKRRREEEYQRCLKSRREFEQWKLVNPEKVYAIYSRMVR